ncbi:MAG: ABC transporter ATP-binding protein [Chloroflexi bacterium]|nr:ABC transporter ATP-binding protein [Chloroflexota bacterium]
MSEPILQVKKLNKYFKTKRGLLHAVDGVSFDLEFGKTLGVVGESGCGKSTLGRTIIRLLEPTGGEIYFEGKDITKLKGKALINFRKNIQMVFQDPFSSLDPRMSVGQIIAEPINLHKLAKDKEDVERRTLELMDTVGLAQRWYGSYPHQLDGGRRQRIGIARALALKPKMIICDEPVSALDVSIQAQILNLLKELQETRNISYLFITHDLSVVYNFSDDIAVMYLGKLVEKAPAEELFRNPIHPYTKALLSAIPVPDINKKRQRIILEGEVFSPINLPDECRFRARCNLRFDMCAKHEPELKEVEPNHFVACWANN